ncbi:MAG: hypothetical protein D8H96_11720 [Lautropia sp.]|nr:MAG: hypothetical protein D8H96_11720 [Lautropia sp.]
MAPAAAVPVIALPAAMPLAEIPPVAMLPAAVPAAAVPPAAVPPVVATPAAVVPAASPAAAPVASAAAPAAFMPPWCGSRMAQRLSESSSSLVRGWFSSRSSQVRSSSSWWGPRRPGILAGLGAAASRPDCAGSVCGRSAWVETGDRCSGASGADGIVFCDAMVKRGNEVRDAPYFLFCRRIPSLCSQMAVPARRASAAAADSSRKCNGWCRGSQSDLSSAPVSTWPRRVWG